MVRHWCSEEHARRAHRKTEQRKSISVLQIQNSKHGLPIWAARCLEGSPADIGKLISDETKKWGKVIVAANIKRM